MRTQICKRFWAWDFDKEEVWLNSMAAKGLALVAVGISRYTFEQTLPGEYTVRLELLENLPGHPESQQYLNFMEETGAEYLGSVTRWVYFRKKTALGSFELFSGNDSRIRHLNGLLTMLGVISVSNLCIGLGNLGIRAGVGSSVNLWAGCFSVGVSALLGAGFLKIWRKKKRLQKESQVFE